LALEIVSAVQTLHAAGWPIGDFLSHEFVADIGDTSLAGELLSSRTMWSVLIVAAAALIQATVGFAAAVFGLPLLLWAGNDLMESQVLIITAMLPQNILAVWKLRKSIDFREVAWPATIRIAALPIGIAGLAVVLTWSASSINQFVGVLILLAIAIQAMVGIEWKGARKPIWMLTVFGGSGILQGISGMSGPPMVLWVHAQRYSTDRARAFLFSMYITNFIPQIGLLWWKFGGAVFHAMAVGLLSLPLVLLSTMLGLKLGSSLGDRWLRTATYAGLMLIALASLLEPWLSHSVVPWIESLWSHRT
jgi:hypothetical protein